VVIAGGVLLIRAFDWHICFRIYKRLILNHDRYSLMPYSPLYHGIYEKWQSQEDCPKTECRREKDKQGSFPIDGGEFINHVKRERNWSM
jgi:hypothetical protein